MCWKFRNAWSHTLIYIVQHFQLPESIRSEFLGCAEARPNRFLQILDELIIAGELQESSKKSVLRVVGPPTSVEGADAQDYSRLPSPIPSKTRRTAKIH